MSEGRLKDKTRGELEDLVLRLRHRREKLDQALDQLREEKGDISRSLNEASQALARVLQQEREERDRLARPEPELRISQHALLRYAERVLGIDFNMFEQVILTPANRAAIEAGATAIKVDGIKLVVQNRCVVTVLD